MLIYFWSAGIGSLLYYMIIRYYTGKWTSTFAGFWLFTGAIHVCGALGWRHFSDIVRLEVQLVLVTVWLVFLVVVLFILQAARKVPEEDADYLIVLGAQVRGRKITNSLMRRLDAAYVYLCRNPRTKVIVSGGKGKGEDISEAEAMSENLLKRGIHAERILREEMSTSTEENLRFSAEIIQRESVREPENGVVLVTNSFHVYRALMLGRQIGYKKLEGLSATSNPVLQLNYLIREFFAIILTKLRAMI